MNKWIRVEDQLPENDGYYILCGKSTKFRPNMVYEGEFDDGDFVDNWGVQVYPTHWMPLPPPPEDK